MLSAHNTEPHAAAAAWALLKLSEPRLMDGTRKERQHSQPVGRYTDWRREPATVIRSGRALTPNVRHVDLNQSLSGYAAGGGYIYAGKKEFPLKAITTFHWLARQTGCDNDTPNCPRKNISAIVSRHLRQHMIQET